LDVPIGVLFTLLVSLIFLSAFFSGTETALMSLNRYRLRHRARSGQRAARVAEQLLKRPDRLIGLILLGNNAVNLGAAALVTIISLRLGGEQAIWIGTMILTFVVLIFAEVAPKTIAALHPMRIALPAALIYYALLKLAYPIVWLINLFANGILRLLGVKPEEISSHSLSAEELRVIVAEAGAMVPRSHRHMLLSILDLDAMTVDDVMLPRQEIIGIDLDRDWSENIQLVATTELNRLPVYRDDVDSIIGVVSVRKLVPAIANGTFDEPHLLREIREPYFVPEGTPLTQALLNFREQHRRTAFVVDEYGDVQGLVTTENILREVVGEFGGDLAPAELGIVREDDSNYVIDASTNIRQLNRIMHWELPTDGPKTLNGLILEQLETIPEPGTKLIVSHFPVEILATSEHAITSVRINAGGSIDGDARLHVASG
jgi:magnesium and cobalt exporter, CNNM family